MIKNIFQIILSLLCLSAQAQKVSNIRAEQRGQDIIVFYFLETTFPCEVNLMLSQDNGATWSAPLKNVSGDVGKNISAGEKQINWKVLEEREQLVGDNLKFKVIADGKKSFEPEMVFVEGGTFQMGSDSGDLDKKPVHSVTLSAFNIGKYEVTQEQWTAVMGNNPSDYYGCNNCPVENVSWNDVQEFILRLNNLSKKKFRLPSEAEWEYSARGGEKTKGYKYSGSENLNLIAWFGGVYYSDHTHICGGKQANELGIHDMSGNVSEWCADWAGMYNNYFETNPTGPTIGEYRVLRGGGWDDQMNRCTSVFRGASEPDFFSNSIGFRLVLPVD